MARKALSVALACGVVLACGLLTGGKAAGLGLVLAYPVLAIGWMGRADR